jgi:hypothetical protein
LAFRASPIPVFQFSSPRHDVDGVVVCRGDGRGPAGLAQISTAGGPLGSCPVQPRVGTAPWF